MAFQCIICPWLVKKSCRWRQGESCAKTNTQKCRNLKKFWIFKICFEKLIKVGQIACEHLQCNDADGRWYLRSKFGVQQIRIWIVYEMYLKHALSKQRYCALKENYYQRPHCCTPNFDLRYRLPSASFALQEFWPIFIKFSKQLKIHNFFELGAVYLLNAKFINWSRLKQYSLIIYYLKFK